MEPSKVVQGLKILQDEGREDLIREGVLEQAWVALRRPKRLSAEGVTAAIIACMSPGRAPKKLKTKSVMGRKVVWSPERLSEVFGAEAVNLPSVRLYRRGGGRFPKCFGTSFHQRMAAGGRGAGSSGAVHVVSHTGERAGGAHAQPSRQAFKMQKQALPPLESGGELLGNTLEEGTLGGAPNMAAPSDSCKHRARTLEERSLSGARKMVAPVSYVEDTVVMSSEDKVEEQGGQSSVDGGGKGTLDGVFIYKEGKIIPWVSRVVSPMLHKVQAWEVDNQAVFKVGEQAEFMDCSVLVLRGTVCGEASGDEKAGTGANLEHIEEELLDYDEEVEAHVASVPKGGMMETPRVVWKVVQRDHLGGRRQELVVENFSRGEDLGLVSVELGGGRVGLGDAIQNANKGIRGFAGKERGKGSVDASIQPARTHTHGGKRPGTSSCYSAGAERNPAPPPPRCRAQDSQTASPSPPGEVPCTGLRPGPLRRPERCSAQDSQTPSPKSQRELHSTGLGDLVPSASRRGAEHGTPRPRPLRLQERCRAQDSHPTSPPSPGTLPSTGLADPVSSARTLREAAPWTKDQGGAFGGLSHAEASEESAGDTPTPNCTRSALKHD
ncbi:hypothetical protein NDU88_005318 [Pleurodeles waltl]|uniref:Uncharacterized protein n=1 Tax=Pleurodeles waltl TaxID=8319 RepID=A0AAV7WYF7_PLEWA|nr:hypothetical protein NDU88_005318 [Pleurodeles waltl]